MVNYVKTTNGYFYKICKNSKKRISEDKYNKQRKIKKMTGGTILNRIYIDSDIQNNSMKNIFMTGDISDDKSSSISRVISLRTINELQTIKNNNPKSNSKNSLGIVYVGEIEYETPARSHVRGKSHIWIRLNRSFGKVRYYVEITDNNNNDYGNHVKVALETLCHTRCDLIIEALYKLGIDLKNNSDKNVKKEEILSLKEEILEIKSQLESLNQELTKKREILIEKYSDLSSKCTNFNWTFSIELPE
jgi:hypothetical protein